MSPKLRKSIFLLIDRSCQKYARQVAEARAVLADAEREIAHARQRRDAAQRDLDRAQDRLDWWERQCRM